MSYVDYPAFWDPAENLLNVGARSENQRNDSNGFAGAPEQSDGRSEGGRFDAETELLLPLRKSR